MRILTLLIILTFRINAFSTPQHVDCPEGQQEKCYGLGCWCEDQKNEFEKLKNITSEMAPTLIGTYLGKCQTEEGSVTDLLFWGYLSLSSGESQLLPMTARFTSSPEIIFSDAINPKNWNLVNASVMREEDRNGNAWMYQFSNLSNQNTLLVQGHYMKGLNPCTRSLPPGNPERFVCNPPELPADKGFGLTPMEDLKIHYRMDLSGKIVSQTVFRQNDHWTIQICRWTHKLSGLKDTPEYFTKPH